MKRFGKMLAFLLAVVMIMTSVFSMTALAAENGYSITVDVNFKGQDYSLYKLFNATTNEERQGAVDPDSESSVTVDGIAYTLIDETDHALDKEFSVQKADGTSVTVKGADWFEFVNTSDKNIKAKEGADVTTEEFRLWALAYGVQTGDTLTASADDDPAIKWEELEDGYYFITTTTGTLVTVDSIAPDAIVKDKNMVPTVDKTVQEDSLVIRDGGTDGDGITGYQKQNDADLDQTVYFKTVIAAKKGASGYVLYDKMADGLTFTGIDNIAVYKGNVHDDHKVDEGNYTAELGGTYYDSEGAEAGNATFNITFDPGFLNSLTEDTNLIVIYSAVVNNEAAIGEAITNDTILKYGNNTFTEESETKTYTWGIDLYKYAGSLQGTHTPLPGAKFILYKLVDGKIWFANFSGASPDYILNATPATAWIKAPEDTTEESLITAAEDFFTDKATLVESDDTGIINMQKLDADTYYLVEVTPPKGYNKLSSKTTVVVDSDSDQDDTVSGDAKHIAEGITADISLKNDAEPYGSVHADIQNNEGTVLPSTGGMGTTLFYVIGAVLVIGAGVLLVVRRRMNDR